MPRDRGYRPDWDVDKPHGEEAEALLRKLRTAILNGTAEVKRDDGVAKYGNVYLEFECRRADGWQPSGLATTKASTWVTVSWPIVVAIPVWILKLVARRAYANGQTRDMNRGSHPTRGVVIPLAELLPHAVEVANAPISDSEAA